MLSRPNAHVVGRPDIQYRRLVGIALRDPYCYRKSILAASKVDRKSAIDVKEQRGNTILEGLKSTSASTFDATGLRALLQATYCIHLFEAQSPDTGLTFRLYQSMLVAARDIPETISICQGYESDRILVSKHPRANSKSSEVQ